jgi:hypothetical protein
MSRFQIYAGILTVTLIFWAVLVTVTPTVSGGMRISEDFSGIPMSADGWHGTAGQFAGSRTVYDTLRTCSLLTRTYTHDSGATGELDIVLGLDLGDFHQPEVCMSGAGWQRVSQNTITVHPKGMPEHEATLDVLRNDMGGDIVLLYWFYMGGKATPTLGSKLQQMVRDVFTTPEPSAMVKFTTVINGDEGAAKRDAIALCETLEKSIVDVARKKPKYEDSGKILKELPEEQN